MQRPFANGGRCNCLLRLDFFFHSRFFLHKRGLFPRRLFDPYDGPLAAYHWGVFEGGDTLGRSQAQFLVLILVMAWMVA